MAALPGGAAEGLPERVWVELVEGEKAVVTYTRDAATDRVFLHRWFDGWAEGLDTEEMERVGGDGFMFSGPLSRRYVAEITDGLVPELQRRGLVRTAYSHAHFRDNLFAF